MGRTQLTSREISGIQRNDLDITTTGEAVVRRLIAGTNISFSSTGVDTGTGDVTINSTGSGITNSAGANVIPKSDGTNLVASVLTEASGHILLGSSARLKSSYQTGYISFHDDTTQNAIRFAPQGSSYFKTYEESGTNIIFQFVPNTGITRLDSYSASLALGSTGGNAIYIDTGNLVGIGHAVPVAQLDVKKTTQQLRLRYDDSNYASFTVASAGNLTVDLAGTTPKFIFGKVITSSLTGSGAPGLDFATNDTYMLARVITNTTGSADKHLYLNYNAGATSDVKLYSNNIMVATVTGGNLLDVDGSITLSGDLTTSFGTIYAGNFSAASGSVTVANAIYNATTWDGDNSVPTKNAVRDVVETLATKALGNLASVAINTSLLPASNDGAALGSSTLSWSDLFLASGALINIANSDWVATHSTGILTVSTGDLRVTTAGTNTASVVTVGGTQTLTGKTLTAPKFADLGFIADANGNELFILDTVTSAVNEITFANAATANNPKFSATGGDANVGIDFQVKGTGVYRFLATASGPTDIRLFEDTDNGTNYASIVAPASMAGDRVLTLPDATDTLVGKATTDVFTNKTMIATTNVVEEITTTTSSSTPTPTGGSLKNLFTVTALAAGATFATPSGSPVNGNRLLIRIKDNGTARTLAWNAIYRAVGVTLPTTTVISKTMYVGCTYNSADSKWDVLAVGQES